MVVIGNPPYNVGQESENDNNRNRPYPEIESRIRATYGRDSHASNTRALGDAYVKFFRWASDRLQGRDGILCFVTNNSFVHDVALDGMRKHLLQDFTCIYHLDLHGNVRKNPKLSGTTHNVFGIKLGVGITVAVRSSRDSVRRLYYYRVPEDWRRGQKLDFLNDGQSIGGVPWVELEPDERNTWRTEGLRAEFGSFIPLGTKEIKAAHAVGGGEAAIFKIYSRGAETTRDQWMYDFSSERLAAKAEGMIETYNAEVSRWIRGGCPRNIDDFVLADETKIKWSSRLKECLARRVEARFNETHIRHALYRPFTRQYLYFDSVMTHRQGMLPSIFPTPRSEAENTVICVPGVGNRKGFGVVAAHVIPDLELAFEKSQCFPLYTYAEGAQHRLENVTDWALSQFQAAYGGQVSKLNIFHYVYAMLHHPDYPSRYAENLKRELPRIPLLPNRSEFETCVQIGLALMKLHLTYETVPEYNLKWRETPGARPDWRVEKMKLSPDQTAVIYNGWLTLAGIPAECFEYRLGNRSALEWVIDQYQMSEDKRSGITSDPNWSDDPEYIAHLVGRVVQVSVETVQLVRELEQKVSLDIVAGEAVTAVTRAPDRHA